MTIPEIASELNIRSKSYQIGELQKIRKQIKGLSKKASSQIFHLGSISDKWAFHYGGRKEIQFNISFEDEGLRYGLAFSLETSRSLPSLNILYPKVRKFNAMVKEDPSTFANYKMWNWRETRSKITAVKPIHPKLVENGTFIFFGKLMDRQQINFDEILGAFDSLLPIYLEIENDPQVVLDTTIPYFQFNNKLRKLPGRSNYTSLQKEIDITARHSFLQDKLYQNLVQLFGEDHVGLENNINGNRIDIVVKITDKEYIFYEIKTGSSARSCIRQGLGQLLDYAYWNGEDLNLTLIIGGEWEIDKKTNYYIRHLEEEFKLPIRYLKIS